MKKRRESPFKDPFQIISFISFTFHGGRNKLLENGAYVDRARTHVRSTSYHYRRKNEGREARLRGGGRPGCIRFEIESIFRSRYPHRILDFIS